MTYGLIKWCNIIILLQIINHGNGFLIYNKQSSWFILLSQQCLSIWLKYIKISLIHPEQILSRACDVFILWNRYGLIIYLLNNWGRPIWAPSFGRCRLSARQLGALLFGRRTFGLRFEFWRKNNEAGNSLNAADRKPVLTTVLNSNASEVSYKPKQGSYRKTKLKKTRQ